MTEISNNTHEPFEQVFLEAYESALGKPYDGDIYRDTPPDSKKYCFNDDWENLDQDMWLLSHPAVSLLNETDRRRLGLTRLLGRSILDFAYLQIEANPELADVVDAVEACRPIETHIDSEPIDLAQKLFFKFQSYYWYKNRAKELGITIDEAFANDDDEEDPDLASPLRIANWPNGQRLNCLGIAIAMSAAVEATGVEYLFANEIRSDSYELANRHSYISKILNQLRPQLKTNTLTSQVHKTLMEAYGEPPEDSQEVDEDEPMAYFYKNHYLDPSVTIANTQPRSQFHHFVAMDTGSQIAQIDPYSLNHSTITRSDKIPNLEDEKNVINFSDPHIYEEIYRALASSMRALPDIIASSFKQVNTPNAYKSINFIYVLIDAVQDAVTKQQELYYELVDADNSNTMKALQKDLVTITVILTYRAIADKYSEYFGNESDEFLMLLGQMVGADEATFEELEPKAAKYKEAHLTALSNLIQYDTEARNDILESFTNIPYLIAAERYSFLLEINFMGKLYNTTNMSSEFGDPALMIGAMYMNHYSRWRKDGKINVACQIARFLPSQLLWQAAMQDEEVDRSIEMLGEQITALPIRRLHPLVGIARQLQR